MAMNMMMGSITNERPKADEALVKIADYVVNKEITSSLAYRTAKMALADSMGCALLSLSYPACRKLLGPWIAGSSVPHGCRIPGTDYVLDPVRGAFNIGAMIRWLDYNDTWLAAEWGHPSDNCGGILALADHLSQKNVSEGKNPIAMQEVLHWMIKAYEVQGSLALLNSFNAVGLDHVILVKVATCAVTAAMLGGNQEQVVDALSNAWMDTGPLRAYRHAPNTGSRKSWAAGDASSRGLQLAWMTLQGEMGYPSVLSAERWGFYDVLFRRNGFSFERELDSYVMENILFKISYPAEFHAQTAVEAAVQLHPKIINRLDQVEKVVVKTTESSFRIINKTGPLHNPADRDHSLQYMIAIGLLFGQLDAGHYEESVAQDPRIDSLREKMEVFEEETFSRDYLDPQKRFIANSLQVFFKDGSKSQEVLVEYPVGHRLRREEGEPLLFEKFEKNLKTQLSQERSEKIMEIFREGGGLETLAVHEWMNLFV